MQFFFKDAVVSALGVALPPDETTSLQLEEALRPTYERLGLIPGRLEALTGIKTRRFFSPATKPSHIAAKAAESCLLQANFDRSQVDCLIHTSVCRDFIEPATATLVHQKLGLSAQCLLFDLSNACLGWMNGLALALRLVEFGDVQAALVVSGENSRNIVESTIEKLNADTALSRKTIKKSIATLTLGSGGVAALVTARKEGGLRAIGATFQNATAHNDLCRGSLDTGKLLMETESDTLLQEGVLLAKNVWRDFRESVTWGPNQTSHIFMHQVGSSHEKKLVSELELDPTLIRSSYSSLGNTGASAVGLTLALNRELIKSREKVLLMGIGSGLVCGMMGLEAL